MRKAIRSAVVVLSMLAASSVVANDCAVQVSNAIDTQRENYINGINGLASNNYSTRPGSYSSMACLDQFMQGGMDIFFRPPDLDSLLQQVLSFACDQVAEIIQGGNGAGGQNQELISLMSSFSGGLTVPSVGGGATSVNMADYLKPDINGTGVSLQSIFGGMQR